MDTNELLAQVESDAATLVEFKKTPYFQVLERYYVAMLEDKKERVLTATKDNFEYWQGVYNGSRDVIMLPEAVTAEAARRRENARV